MIERVLIVDIGQPENDIQDFIQIWEAGKITEPVNKLTFESIKGFINAFTPMLKKTR